MNEATKQIEQKETDPKPKSIFEIEAIDVTVYYDFTEPPTGFVWPTKPLLNEDEKAARQKFFSQPEDKQSAGAHRYNCELLASITVAEPRTLPGCQGLPGFIEGRNDYDLKTYIPAYFGGDDPRGMKAKIVLDILNKFYTMTENKNFFR